jgi:hypothetical protein
VSDRYGAQLSPGDPVDWFGRNRSADGVPATVMRALGPNGHLIRIGPQAPDVPPNINVANRVNPMTVSSWSEAVFG